MEWISVTERLPEEGQRVLALGTDGRMELDIYQHPKTTSLWVPIYQNCNPVTHWMPLPEPPNPTKLKQL